MAKAKSAQHACGVGSVVAMRTTYISVVVLALLCAFMASGALGASGTGQSVVAPPPVCPSSKLESARTIFVQRKYAVSERPGANATLSKLPEASQQMIYARAGITCSDAVVVTDPGTGEDPNAYGPDACPLKDLPAARRAFVAKFYAPKYRANATKVIKRLGTDSQRRLFLSNGISC